MRIIPRPDDQGNIMKVLEISLVIDKRLSRIMRRRKINKKDIEIFEDNIEQLNLLVTAKGEFPVELIKSIKANDIKHSTAVCLMTMYFFKGIGQYEDKLTTIALGALLHDIGKIKLNRRILYKKERLTDEEFQHIKEHPVLGVKLVDDLIDSVEIKTIILLHHKTTGDYPSSNVPTFVPNYVDLVAVIDVLCAVLQKRVYHRDEKSYAEIFYILNDISTKISLNVTQEILKMLPVFDVGDMILTETGNTLIVYKVQDNLIGLRNIFDMTEYELRRSQIDIKFLIKGKDDLKFLSELVARQDIFINIFDDNANSLSNYTLLLEDTDLT